MRRVDKYIIGGSMTTISLPEGAVVVGLDVVNAQPTLYVLRDDSGRMEDRVFLRRGLHEAVGARERYVGHYTTGSGPTTYTQFVFEEVSAT